MRIIKYAISAIMAICAATASAEEPSGYYETCQGLGGEALLKKLHEKIGQHTAVSYNGLWSLYHTSDIDENGKIWDMYSTKRWKPGSEQCGTYSEVGDCYNREHSFPKSWFDDASPMVSDAFHIYPTDGKVNGQRSNYPYGECANGKSVAAAGGYKPLGKLGASTFTGYSGTVFEPDDEYKGDFARSYFYMATAYNNRISNWSSDMLSGNSYPAFSTWALNLLLKWHRQDPVSAKETARNEVVYGAQHNRNPYIDHPELVEYVWGNKKNEQWYGGTAPEPEILLPVDGTTVDFGLTATNYQISRAITVKGSNLSGAVSLSVSSSDFKLSATSISAADANQGKTVSVTFRSAKEGNHTATLSIASGSAKATVTLSATTIDGIPALPATDIEATSFTARWSDIGVDDTYQLVVKQGDKAVTGYPATVYAANEEYEVDDLEPATEYSYQLTSGDRQSNIIKVTTASLIPSIELSINNIDFTAKPGEPSEAVEVWFETENIEGDIAVSVPSPFELSNDMLNWSQTLSLDAMENRFFLRLGATDEGEYEGFITMRVEGYINDGTHVYGMVVAEGDAWFIEDFERASAENGADGGYSAKSYSGRTGLWNLVDCGIFAESNTTADGKYSVRLGKTSSSTIATAQPKERGIGKVTFQAARWSDNDGDVTLVIEYSADGQTWTEGAIVVVTTNDMQQYTAEVNAKGSNFLRLRQNQQKGARGNVDDIAVTDFAVAGIDDAFAADIWNAYVIDGELTVTNSGAPTHFIIFDVEGRMHVDSTIAPGAVTFTLPPGLYFVTDNQTVRRVIIR